LKLAEIIVIANQFFTFLVFFFCRKARADDDALFGIGQGYKPYPTNDASAYGWQQLYISPIFTIFFTDEYRRFSPLFKIHDFMSEASIFPLFTLVFSF